MNDQIKTDAVLRAAVNEHSRQAELIGPYLQSAGAAVRKFVSAAQKIIRENPEMFELGPTFAEGQTVTWTEGRTRRPARGIVLDIRGETGFPPVYLVQVLKKTGAMARITTKHQSELEADTGGDEYGKPLAGTMSRRVYDVLAEYPGVPVTTAEIRAECNLTSDAASNFLGSLWRSGYIRKVGTGRSLVWVIDAPEGGNDRA